MEAKWTDLCKAQDVSVYDTEWVQAVGAFKTAHTWVGTPSFPYPFMVSPNATSGVTGGKTVLCQGNHSFCSPMQCLQQVPW